MKKISIKKKILAAALALGLLLSLTAGCRRTSVPDEPETETASGPAAPETAPETSGASPAEQAETTAKLTETPTEPAESPTETAAEAATEQTKSESAAEAITEATTEQTEATTEQTETPTEQVESPTETTSEATMEQTETTTVASAEASSASAEEPTASPSVSASEESSSSGQTELSDEDENIWAEDFSATPCESVSYALSPDSFDERFLQYISDSREGNYMVSPLSFRYALGLLLAGASGETKTELLQGLGVSAEEEWIRHCLIFNGFVNRFTEASAAGMNSGQALRVANSVWKRADIQADFTEAYKASVCKNYAAEYRSFTPENAVSKINRWADVKTEGMIKRLLPDDYPADDLAVVLMNALYYKGSWLMPFSAQATEEGDFHTEGGITVRKDFMHMTDGFRYYEDAETQLVILPMANDVSMAFVLGSTERIGEKVSAANYARVRLTIPKLELESSFDDGEFVDFLKKSGVKQAFSPDFADFSAMIGHPVFVDDIIQKTRIKLDEDGVEAAAVTAIMTKDTAVMNPPEPVEFTADRPFSFCIYTTVNDTTSILFAGEIVE